MAGFPLYLEDVVSKSSQELDDFLDNYFATPEQRTAKLIAEYGSLYSLPFLSKEFKVDPNFFYFTTKSTNFIVITVYNDEKEILIIHSPNKFAPYELVDWRLPGGSIHDRIRESIEEAVNRIVSKLTDLEIAELEPIAIVKNKFCWDSGSKDYLGLAFIARAEGVVKMPKDQAWMFTANPPEKMDFLNREVFLLASEKIRQKYFEPPLAEIHTAHRFLLLRLFHKLIFKPLTYWLASYPLRKKVMALISHPDSVLDISAGDDELILEIARGFSPGICVANDISWKQMASLRADARFRALKIQFTNHNIVELPFTQSFDIVIYKNTLHHIRSKEELLAVFNRLRSISKRLIIVDVEDPKAGWLSYLFHLYYVHIYGDGEDLHHFFTRDTFVKLIRLAFVDAHEVRFEKIHTIKGNYLIATIDFI